MAAVAGLTLASPDLLGVHDLLQLLATAQLLERLDGRLGLRQGLDAVGDHQRQLRHLADAVASGHDQGRQAAGGQGHGHCVALLGDVHAAVPAAPDPRGVEHAAAAGLVAKRGLAGAVSATSRGAWDTGHRPAGAPGLGCGVVASLGANGVGLALVLGHVHVHIADEVRPQRGREDVGHLHCAGLLGGVLEVEDGNHRPCGCHGCFAGLLSFSGENL